MTDNLNEPPLADIIMDVRENFIYLRNENLRLQEENNQLKQAIAALKDEATNSLWCAMSNSLPPQLPHDYFQHPAWTLWLHYQ